MKHEDQTSLPDRRNYFYKYRTDDLKLSCQIFTRNELHFSIPSAFNDSSDSKFELRWDGSYADQLEFWLSRLRKDKSYLAEEELLTRAESLVKAGTDQFQKSIEDQANREVGAYGICCLSEAPYIRHMWEVYANEHRGFCLEFSNERCNDRFGVEPKRDEQYPNPERLRPCQVTYSDHPKVVNRIKDEGFIVAQKTVLTKATKWKDEKEWRMVDMNGPGPHPFRAHCLTSVIFGYRMLKEHKKRIYAWCKDRETAISYYQAQPNEDRSSLDIVELKTSRLTC